jgi:hypothetical protein
MWKPNQRALVIGPGGPNRCSGLGTGPAITEIGPS